MKFIITGSGGCVSIPRPLCTCKICNEARDKGYPYVRCGCSLFLDDIKLLQQEIACQIQDWQWKNISLKMKKFFEENNFKNIDVLWLKLYNLIV